MVIKSKKKNKSVYGSGPEEVAIERHTLSVLVDNESGVLARVIGLFSGRGYNIESLTVSEVSKRLNQSRMTIVTTGIPAVIDQIRLQLSRLVPVHKVTDLTEKGEYVERDLALIKIVGTEKDLKEATNIAENFSARTIDTTEGSLIFEITELPHKIDEFIQLMKPLGLVNISRTGTAAISCGKEQM